MNDLDYFERQLDDKHRLSLPPKLRQHLGRDKVVITRGFGKYLHLYPEKVWLNQVEPTLSGDILDERVADLNVRFRMGNQVSRLDSKQGRITLSQHLREYSGITKDVVAVRVGTYWRLMSKKYADKESLAK